MSFRVDSVKKCFFVKVWLCWLLRKLKEKARQKKVTNLTLMWTSFFFFFFLFKGKKPELANEVWELVMVRANLATDLRF